MNKTKVKVHIMAIIHAVVYISFGFIMLANIVALTYTYIDYEQGRFEIQKRNVTIEALLVSCENDYLIKQHEPWKGTR